jgi:hypothetical protein
MTTPNPHEEGINERMKRLIARPFCPKCYLFLEEHDNEACDMRWEEDACVTSVQKPEPLPLLPLWDGDFGSGELNITFDAVLGDKWKTSLK